jgi:hypothetical protein
MTMYVGCHSMQSANDDVMTQLQGLRGQGPIATGSGRSAIAGFLGPVPFPNSPTPLSPQHHAPASMTAQVVAPAAIVDTLPGALIGVGTKLSAIDPFPNMPSLVPQHTPEPSTTAQAWADPIVMLVTP